jgi:hypothetical protein
MGTGVDVHSESKEWRPGGARPAPASPPPGPASACPLTEEQFLLIGQTAIRKKAVRKAARTACASACTTLVLGVLAVPFAIFSPSWESVAAAAILCTVGTIEYFGSRRMLQALPGAAAMLGFNQVGFLAAIVAYCLIEMLTLSPESLKQSVVTPDVRSQLTMLPSMDQFVGKIDSIAPLLMYGFYGLVIVLSLFLQGGLSLYYFTRRRLIRAYYETTPDWARRVLLASEA